ncbi:phage tail tape measure protein, partial [Candidatus Parcubacteria bacterium]
MAINVGSLFVNIKLRTAELQADVAKVQKELRKFGRRMQGIGRSISQGVALPTAAAIGLSVRSFAKFDEAMAKSTAIMGNLSDAMRKDLRKAALETSKVTTFSAKEAADAFFFLASAGLNAKDSIAALPVVAKFAQAGSFDLATATTLLADTQKSMGLAIKNDAVANMQELIHVSDVLVKANTLANATVQQFSEAITNKLGGSLRKANQSLEDGVAVLAALADQGIKGAEAGTQLGIAVRELSIKALSNADAFKKLNIRVFNSAGNMRFMGDIIADIEKAFEGMSTKQQTAALKQLGFQNKTLGTIKVLLGTSEAIKLYREELDRAAGVTDEVARKNLNNLNAQLLLTRNALERLGIALGGSVSKELGQMLKWTRDIIDAFTKINPKIIKFVTIFAGIVIVVGPAIRILGALVSFMGGPFTLAFAAGGTAVAAIVTFRKELEKTLAVIPQFFREIKFGLKALKKFTAETIAHPFDDARTRMRRAIDATVKDLIREKRALEAAAKAAENNGRINRLVFNAIEKGVNVLKQYIRFKPAADKATNEINEKLAEAFRKLQKEYESTIRTIKENDLTKAIDEAITSGNVGDLQRALDGLRVVTRDKFLAGIDESLLKTTAGRNLADKIFNAQWDAKVKEVTDRFAQAMKEKNEEAFKENVDFFRNTFENAITGATFNLKDIFRRIAVGFAAQIAAALVAGSASAQAIIAGIKSPQDLGGNIAKIIIGSNGGGTGAGIFAGLFGGSSSAPIQGPLTQTGSFLESLGLTHTQALQVGDAFASIGNAAGAAAAFANVLDGINRIGKNTKETVKGIFEVGGAAIGATFGGPIGAGIGSFIGKTIGKLIGGLFGKDSHVKKTFDEFNHNLNKLIEEKAPGGIKIFN